MIAFRWNVASGGGQHPFTPQAILALFEHSKGVPREACIIADNSLLLAYYRRSRLITDEIVRQVVADRRAGLNTPMARSTKTAKEEHGKAA